MAQGDSGTGQKIGFQFTAPALVLNGQTVVPGGVNFDLNLADFITQQTSNAFNFTTTSLGQDFNFARGAFSDVSSFIAPLFQQQNEILNTLGGSFASSMSVAATSLTSSGSSGGFLGIF